MTRTTINNATTIRFKGVGSMAHARWDDADIFHSDGGLGDLRTFHLSASDRVFANNQRLAVTMVYDVDAQWCIGIGPIADEDPMPPWTMRWSFVGYSAVLDVDVPAGTTIWLTRVSRVIKYP